MGCSVKENESLSLRAEEWLELVRMGQRFLVPNCGNVVFQEYFVQLNTRLDLVVYGRRERT